jgi:hypothetical protein
MAMRGPARLQTRSQTPGRRGAVGCWLSVEKWESGNSLVYGAYQRPRAVLEQHRLALLRRHALATLEANVVSSII